MRSKLREWERGLPYDHTWNTDLLKEYKAKGIDLVCFIPLAAVHFRANIFQRRI